MSCKVNFFEGSALQMRLALDSCNYHNGLYRDFVRIILGEWKGKWKLLRVIYGAA